jgi:hypothetical protein
MPKRQLVPLPGQPPMDSQRWPNLFAQGEAEVLFSHRGWAAVLADLKDKVRELSDDIVHRVPSTPEANAELNFFRGKVAAFEDLLGLGEEWEQWKKTQKELK